MSIAIMFFIEFLGLFFVCLSSLIFNQRESQLETRGSKKEVKSDVANKYTESVNRDEGISTGYEREEDRDRSTQKEKV